MQRATRALLIALPLLTQAWVARADPTALARRNIEEHAHRLGLADRGLDLGRATVSKHLSQTLVFFEPHAAGLPIFFARATVQLDQQGAVRRSAVHLPPVRAADADPAAHPSDCLEAAAAWAADRGLIPLAPRAGWIAARDGTLEPVVRVEVRRPGDPEPTAVFLHARWQKVVHAEPAVDYHDPPAAVFLENPVTTPNPVIVGLPFLAEMRRQRLDGAYTHVRRCADVLACETGEVGAGPDDKGHFLFGPVLEPYTFDDPFAEVNAYYHLSNINHWMREEFGWEHDFGGETWIEARVGVALYNAYYYHGNDEIPPRIAFGQDTIDFAYDADVAFHEFGHGINRSLWSHPWFFPDRFGMDLTPFGIEEGLADIWAVTYAGDPVMNTYVTRARTADNDLTCPRDLRAEGHMEARIVAGFGWDVREIIGAQAFDHIVYRTLAFLEPQAALDELVQALAVSAADLAAEGDIAIPAETVAVLYGEGEKRGFFEPDCLDRFVPLTQGREWRVYGYGRTRTYGHDFPFGLQWRLVTPADRVAFRIHFEWAYPADRERGFRVHISRGRPVEVSWYKVQDLEDGEPAFDVQADRTIGGGPSYVDFPVIGHEPLAPGEEVYVLLSSASDARTIVVDPAVWFLPELPPPSATNTLDAPQPAPASAGSWSPSCAASRAGALAEPRAGLLGAIAALID